MCEILSRMKSKQPIRIANLNSVWDDFVVRDKSPRINNSRYVLISINKFSKARIIFSRTWPIRQLSNPMNFQKIIGRKIFF